MTDSDIVLGVNQYGKAEVRLVRIDRETPVHRITDLTVTSQLRGDFTACYTDGDNADVLTTDTQKNTVYAKARDGIGSPESFLLRLADHFVTTRAPVSGGRWEAWQHGWDRAPVAGAPHDHTFVRAGGQTRTAVVVADGDRRFVVAGVTGWTLLKSTGSEFHGFPKDSFTTLPETDDRILATSVTARWRYTDELVVSKDPDWDGPYAQICALMLEVFATLHSLSLQQTLFAMGKAVLEACPQVAELRFAMPNKHHFLVDLAPFGLDNPGEVFQAPDRPYGLIEATVEREGGAPAPAAWT